jgi:hypothetical protein
MPGLWGAKELKQVPSGWWHWVELGTYKVHSARGGLWAQIRPGHGPGPGPGTRLEFPRTDTVGAGQVIHGSPTTQVRRRR